jgi:hypothetical protein
MVARKTLSLKAKNITFIENLIQEEQVKKSFSAFVDQLLDVYITHKKHKNKIIEMEKRYQWYAENIEPNALQETEGIRDTAWLDSIQNSNI